MDERDRPANELLYDTEAALRLVDKALDEICGPSDGHPDGQPDALPGAPPTAAASARAAATLALVRHAEPGALSPRPALAAELADILEDIRLGRALLDRARTRRAAPLAGSPQAGSPHGACAAIVNQYVDGTAHLLADLEQRVAQLAEMLTRGERNPAAGGRVGTRDP